MRDKERYRARKRMRESESVRETRRNRESAQGHIKTFRQRNHVTSRRRAERKITEKHPSFTYLQQRYIPRQSTGQRMPSITHMHLYKGENMYGTDKCFYNWRLWTRMFRGETRSLGLWGDNAPHVLAEPSGLCSLQATRGPWRLHYTYIKHVHHAH